MSQHPLNPGVPPGARSVVYRGSDAATVARYVRCAVGGGLVLPPGPYRYPYAAVIQLLREASLFADPAADTAEDVMVSREALCDQLAYVLQRGVYIGVLCADNLDDASARLLAGFAAIAQIAVAHGHRVSGLVLGTSGDLAACLEFADAEIREAYGARAPTPVLDRAAAHVLAVMQAAPHPVLEDSLLAAADVGARAAQAAIRMLASADMLHVGSRIALGPAVVPSADEATAWPDSPELRLPLARLSVQPDHKQAVRLAEQAMARGAHDVALWCMSRTQPTTPHELLLLAGASAASGQHESAYALIAPLTQTDLPPSESFELAKVQVALVASGLCASDAAEASLRAAERSGFALAARPLRAQLLASRGNVEGALTLLRRTRRQELEAADPTLRLQHEFAEIRCKRQLGGSGTGRRWRQTASMCVTRAQQREFARLRGDTAEYLQLSARDFDAAALRGTPEAVGDAIRALLGTG
jgi:hypothetical protein